jgi:hypothetical protein
MKRGLQCAMCKHVHPWEEGSARYMCAAFPQGVPRVIEDGYFHHDLPYPGDSGLRWVPANEAYKDV